MQIAIPDTTLVYPATHSVTFRARLSRQCEARSAGNGTPFTRIATPQCRLGRAPAGRARMKRPIALIRGVRPLGKGVPFPASPALRLSAFRLAESYRMSGGVQ